MVLQLNENIIISSVMIIKYSLYILIYLVRFLWDLMEIQYNNTSKNEFWKDIEILQSYTFHIFKLNWTWF